MLNRYLRVLLCEHCWLITWLLIPVVSLSQSPSTNHSKFWKNSSIGLRSYYGSFLITKPKAEYIRDSYASFGELYYQFQTKGRRDWEINHRYPQWGIALMNGNTGSRQYIGRMTAFYAYLTLPVIRSANYHANLLIGTGPGIVSKPYDIHTNPKNTLIGTRLNAFINMGFQNEFRFFKNFTGTIGLHFLHLSNGGTTLPNLGLNTPSIAAGIRYALGNPDTLDVIAHESYQSARLKLFRFNLFTSVSSKQAPWAGGNHYLINVLQTEAVYRRKPNHSYGLGLMFTYNRSLDFFPLENPSYETRGQKKLQIGPYAHYEHFFGRLSVPLQLGVYAYNRAKSPILFQQFGLRYRIIRKISAELLLKSHMGQADFIHTGIGYTF
jgi:hypothetical protein